jgi:hypothetical protein
VKYKAFLDCLVQVGVLETDGYYVEGLKSKGYKFTEAYIGVELKAVELQDFVLCGNIKALSKDKVASKEKSLRKYMHIVKWFLDKGLEIDRAAALSWIGRQHQIELQQLLSSIKSQKELRAKKLFEVWQASRHFAEKLYAKGFDISDFTTDDFGNRLHGMFTYQRSELRNFITYRGQKLVSVDIKNSQPYFSTLLLDRDFYRSEKYRTNKIKLIDINENIYRQVKQQPQIRESIMYLDSSQSLSRRRVAPDRYRADAVSGQLYERFQQSLAEQIPADSSDHLRSRVKDRKAVKRELLRTLYVNNQDMEYPFYKPSHVFEATYPDAMRLFKALKADDHKLLAKIIQQMESHCVLKLICGRIAQERPDLPIFTIHDSIVTTVGNEQYVKDIIVEVLSQKIGAPPQVKLEHWCPENLK